MSAQMKLGLFQFKNDTVLLLAATPVSAANLADRLETAIENGSFTIPIHELAEVSKKHSAKLFASSEATQKLGEREFWWKCNDVTVKNLRDIARRSGEQYFELSRPFDLFSVSCTNYYNDQWWQTYG